MPRWPKKVQSIEPIAGSVDSIVEEQPLNLIERTTCGTDYHLERGVAIGSGSFVCKFCGKRFVYNNGQLKEYV